MNPSTVCFPLFCVSLPAWKYLKSILHLGLLASVMGHGHAAPSPRREGTPGEVIKDYFAGWERKDWDQVARQLAEGFTFTSPAPDDHLSIDQFKAKCWNQADHIQRFEFPRICGNDEAAFAIVQVITRDGEVIRNTEYFTFRAGKIASIEVFFGGNGLGFPTNVKQAVLSNPFISPR
jgi:ketosteroid isomerase-like protein